MRDSEHKSIDLLWSSFLNGDDKGFSVIYQLHINRLLSYGYKLCPDREWVHDSIQEVFPDLFLKRKKQERNIENLKAWLFVAIRNSLVKKMVKSRKFEPIVTDGEQEFIFFNRKSLFLLSLSMHSKPEVAFTRVIVFLLNCRT